MKLQIVGVEKSVGEFVPPNSNESIKFNNYNLYGLDYDNRNMIAGNKAVKIKLKIDEYNRVCSYQPADLVSHVVNIYYNQYGKVETIEVVK